MSHNIIHLGAEHCVTGSCHLLQVKGANLLIDCGTAQGNDLLIPFSEWPVPPSKIDCLFLTHAHIDHIGRVPDLIRQGFAGDIIATHATKALIQPMFEDALRFSEWPREDVDAVLSAIEERCRGVEYDQPEEAQAGIRFTFGQAGHILGSGFIRFEWDNPSFSVVFSGDIGASDTPILPDASIPAPCDLLIMESTYGDRNHEDRSQRLRRLAEVLSRAMADGGKIFIPAFSLGRTQELIYELDRLYSDPTWQQEFPLLKERSVPVFIDSPLGEKISTIYATLSKYWDAEAKANLKRGDHPLNFAQLHNVESGREHHELVEMRGPAIIIAGSGMCTGGRILAHLQRGLADAKNDVLFVGYQADGTTGRNIIQYSEKPGGYARIDGKQIPIHAKVHVLSGYSAHADQKDLLRWVERMVEKPGKIKLIHGETEPQQILGDALRQRGYAVI